MSGYPSYEKQYNDLTSEQKIILKKIPFLESIGGWLLLIEAITLYSITSKIKSSNPVVCEIGVWKGKSSYVFSSALKKINGKLYSIDPFNAEGDKESETTYQNKMSKLDSSLLENFKKTMDKYKLLDIINIIPTTSKKAYNEFPEKQIALLFIDGNHDYKSVKDDFETWSPLLVKDGQIVLHDVGANHVDGPKKVFKEKILNSPDWKDVRIVGEMGIAVKS